MSAFIVMMVLGVVSVIAASVIITTPWTPTKDKVAVTLFALGIIAIVAGVPVGVFSA